MGIKLAWRSLESDESFSVVVRSSSFASDKSSGSVEGSWMSCRSSGNDYSPISDPTSAWLVGDEHC